MRVGAQEALNRYSPRPFRLARTGRARAARTHTVVMFSLRVLERVHVAVSQTPCFPSSSTSPPPQYLSLY